MKIGLDFDDTYTAAPELFDNFIRVAKFMGHEVKFVTWRFANHRPDGLSNADIEAAARRNRIDVIFCEGKAKEDCYKADVWIDDMPYAVINNAPWCTK